MLISQSKYVLSKDNSLSKPLLIISKYPEIEASKHLTNVIYGIAEFDLVYRLRNEGKIEYCLYPGIINLLDDNFSCVEALNNYNEVKNIKPVDIESGGFCSNSTTESYINNVLYSEIRQPAKECDPLCMKYLSLCLAAPFCCPIYLLCFLSQSCVKEKDNITKLEEIKSLFSSIKAVDNFIDNAKETKGICCCNKRIKMSKEILKLILKFLIVDEVDQYFNNSISKISDFDSSMNEIIKMINDQKRKNKVKDKMDKFKIELSIKREEMLKGFEEEIYDANEESSKYYISSRLCKDFISNDLVDYLFRDSEETPIGTSISFVRSKSLSNDKSRIKNSIMMNLNLLGDTITTILPSKVEEIISIIRKRINPIQTTSRIKSVKKLIDKTERELSNGIQDLFGVRLFVANDRLFRTFSVASMLAYELKDNDKIKSIVVCHKFNGSTGFMDYKFLIELSCNGNPYFEVQILPCQNFIIDEMVKGHDVHDSSNNLKR